MAANSLHHAKDYLGHSVEKLLDLLAKTEHYVPTRREILLFGSLTYGRLLPL